MLALSQQKKRFLVGKRGVTSKEMDLVIRTIKKIIALLDRQVKWMKK